MKSFLIFLVLLGSSNSSLAIVKKITGSNDFTCALSTSGKVKCWGYNLFGQLGLGDTITRGNSSGQMGDQLPYVNLGTGAKAVDLCTFWQHTCAVLDTGKVKCWGFNTSGQLGIPDVFLLGASTFDMGDDLPSVDLGENQKVIQVTTGEQHSCALFENGKVKCWGGNDFGQLGLGDKVPRGKKAGTMGKALPFVELGNARVVKLSSGSNTNCALFENGKTKCWGVNQSGQLGLEDFIERGEKPNQMGDNLPFLDLGTSEPAIDIVSSAVHTCALFADGKLKCWGDNSYGELGGNKNYFWGGAKNEMGANLPTVDLGGEKVTKIHLGSFSTCALLQSKQIKCWGLNNSGQLGIGSTKEVGKDPAEMGNALKPVGVILPATTLFGGIIQRCATLLNGGLQCWGANTFGALGIESSATVGDDLGDLGNGMEYTELGSDF